MFVWKRTYSPFVMGGNVNRNVKTEINENDFTIIDLGKGFKGIFIEKGKSKGVYELESGGLIGDTVQNVKEDIAACEDVSFMRKQIEEAKEEGAKATVVSNEDFFGRN